jgi:hypothetical protein
MSVHSNDYNDTPDMDNYSSSESNLDFEPNAYDEEDSYLSPSVGNNAKRNFIPSEPGLKIFTRFNGKRNVRIRAYETVGVPGRLIRDAITGIKTQYKFGSLDEYSFFSVCVSTGEHGQEPSFLFFDSPEQYERTFYTTVPAQMKSRWVERFRERQSYLAFESSHNEGIVVK